MREGRETKQSPMEGLGCTLNGKYVDLAQRGGGDPAATVSPHDVNHDSIGEWHDGRSRDRWILRHHFGSINQIKTSCL